MPIKKGPKIAALVLGFGTIAFGLNYLANHSSFNIGKILTPTKVGQSIPDLKDAEIANVTPIAFPSTACATVNANGIRLAQWEWNAQMGELLANGGNCTTKGSLMEKHGVNLTIYRQDDTGKMGEDLVKCAQEIHDGATSCSTGANGVIIMGDGAAQFIAGVNPLLLKLGPDYGLKIIGAVGYSRGEDKFEAPQSLKDDPHTIAATEMKDASGSPLPTHGVLVGGVIRDGDWNIAVRWAGDNNLPNNPDDKTFDSGAINWINESDYITAANDYVAGKCEDRKEVSGGKLTGKTVHVCMNGVVTWTPGDVIIAQGKGGIVPIVSSKEYRSQMPSVLIVSNHFANANHVEFQNLLQAAFEGADQIKAFDSALRKASEISARVYADQGGKDEKGHDYTNGVYWYTYFHDIKRKDVTGVNVSLGGSAVANLADNKILFGFDGNTDLLRATYTTFAQIDFQQYPDLFKLKGVTPLPDFKSVEDKSYITGVIMAASNNDTPEVAADTVDYSKAGSGDVISSHVYSGDDAITFATGSSNPDTKGLAALDRIMQQLALTGLKIKIVGYTDNTGSDVVNTNLSAGRANAVKQYLQTHAAKQFPSARFDDVIGKGPADPIASNDTAVGKAANRRVVIIQEN